MMPSNQAYGRRNTPKFEADPLNSTYRWEMYLTPGLPGNKVSLLDGYSKGQGYENPNKVLLLHRKLVNPVLTFLKRCDTIVIYEPIPGLPKEYHTKILELYPNDFFGYGWVKDDMTINRFLADYYTTYIRTGTMPPLEDRRKNARQDVYMADLDHSKYKFLSIADLKVFCRTQSEKYGTQCMHGWYYSHAQFQPELFENNIVGTMRQAMNEAPNLEQAQAAQAAMGNMLNKRTGRY